MFNRIFRKNVNQRKRDYLRVQEEEQLMKWIYWKWGNNDKSLVMRAMTNQSETTKMYLSDIDRIRIRGNLACRAIQNVQKLDEIIRKHQTFLENTEDTIQIIGIVSFLGGRFNHRIYRRCQPWKSTSFLIDESMTIYRISQDTDNSRWLDGCNFA